MKKQHVIDYIQSDGSYCPYCKSSNIEGMEFEYEGTYRRVICLECGEQWKDIYKLVGISTEDEEIIVG